MLAFHPLPRQNHTELTGQIRHVYGIFYYIHFQLKLPKPDIHEQKPLCGIYLEHNPTRIYRGN